MTTTSSHLTASAFCPACDPRAIGMDADDVRRVVRAHTVSTGDTVNRCGNCGTTFAGTAAAPVKHETMRLFCRGDWCRCGPDETRQPHAFDFVFTDESGNVERVHGWQHNECGGWTQIG